MPQRFLRPGIRDSEKWNSCDWAAQSLYIRLLTLVDDQGRFDAHPLILRGHCFALREDVDRLQVVAWCEELSEHGLAIFYETGGKRYLQLTNWRENARSESKFPAFDNTCKQLFTDASSCKQLSADTTPGALETDASGGALHTNVSKCSLPSSSPSSSPSGERRCRASHPTLEEVKLEGAKTGLPDAEAEKFFNFYESNGWKVGRNPMKSWTAALSNWKIRTRQQTKGAARPDHAKGF